MPEVKAIENTLIASVLPLLVLSACARPEAEIQHAVRMAFDQVYAVPDISCEGARMMVANHLSLAGFEGEGSYLSDGHYTVGIDQPTRLDRFTASQQVAFEDYISVAAASEEGDLVIVKTANCKI